VVGSVTVAAVVLAAGSSVRMGRDKLRLSWRGRPLLERAVAPLVDAAGVDEVVVVVPPGFSWPGGLDGCRLVEAPDHREGMGASLRAGVAAVDPEVDACLVALGDMPEVSVELVEALVRAFEQGRGSLVAPVYRGRRGHPVLLGRVHRPALLALSGDVGARSILRDHPDELVLLPVDERGVVLDVDTLADLEAGHG